MSRHRDRDSRYAGNDNDDRGYSRSSIKREQEGSRSRHRERDGDRDSRRHRDRGRPRSRSPLPRHGPKDSSPPPESPERPNYHRSGLLALDRNRVSVASFTTNASNPESYSLRPAAAAAGTLKDIERDTVVLKYHEPQDRAPAPPDAKSVRYALVHFPADKKAKSQTVSLGRRTYYLIGSDTRIAHIPLQVPPAETDSKGNPRRPKADAQHAVIQYRVKQHRDNYGDTHNATIPYLIDLESARGTYLNGKKIPSAAYVELKPRDVIEFGSMRDEYVFMKEDV